jgi:two-component system, NtrC family, sensor histidine kinase HydH
LLAGSGGNLDAVSSLSFLEGLKAYVGFDDAASASLAEVQPIVAPHAKAIIDDFYDTIEAHPGARSAITGGAAQILRLKQSLLRWLDELFRGPHDEAYFERRARIGRVHVRIELPQGYMFTAMDRIRVRTTDVLREALSTDPPKLQRATTAVHQIMDIELAIMLETYREDLVAKNRTAERLATIGQFAAGIGHELRNPLGVVQSSVFLVRQRLQQLGLTDPSVVRHLEKIATEVDRSTKTINDLLELARSRPPKRSRVAAGGLIEQAVAAARVPDGVQVTIQADGVSIDADPDQLGRIISNLVINAGQAMEGKGNVWVDAERRDAQTVIRVRDDGPGVPADIRHRVFEALFTTKAKGSGLGLALCRRIAEAHGGTIVLEPSDRGASFLITVPDG